MKMKTMATDLLGCMFTPPAGDNVVHLTTGGYGGQSYDSFDKNMAQTLCENDTSKVNWNRGCVDFDEKRMKTGNTFIDNFCVSTGVDIPEALREPGGRIWKPVITAKHVRGSIRASLKALIVKEIAPCAVRAVGTRNGGTAFKVTFDETCDKENLRRFECQQVNIKRKLAMVNLYLLDVDYTMDVSANFLNFNKFISCLHGKKNVHFIPMVDHKHTPSERSMREAYNCTDPSGVGKWLYEKKQHMKTGTMCHTFLTVMFVEVRAARNNKQSAKDKKDKKPLEQIPAVYEYVSIRLKMYSKFCQMLESHTVGGTGCSHLNDWVWTSDDSLREKIYDADFQENGVTRLNGTAKRTFISVGGSEKVMSTFFEFVKDTLTFNSIANQWIAFCLKLKSSCFIVDTPRGIVTHVRWINSLTKSFNSHRLSIGCKKTHAFMRDVQHFAFNLPVYLYVLSYDVVALEARKPRSNNDKAGDNRAFRLVGPDISEWLERARAGERPFVFDCDVDVGDGDAEDGCDEEDGNEMSSRVVVPRHRPCHAHIPNEQRKVIDCPYDGLKFRLAGEDQFSDVNHTVEGVAVSMGFVGKWIAQMESENDTNFTTKFVDVRMVPLCFIKTNPSECTTLADMGGSNEANKQVGKAISAVCDLDTFKPNVSAAVVGFVPTPQLTFKLYLHIGPRPSLGMSMMPAPVQLKKRVSAIYTKPRATTKVQAAYTAGVLEEMKIVLDTIGSFSIPELDAVTKNVSLLPPGRYTLVAIGKGRFRGVLSTYVSFSEIPAIRFKISDCHSTCLDSFKMNEMLVVKSTWDGGICAMIEDPDVGKVRTVYACALQQQGKHMSTLPDGEKMFVKMWSCRRIGNGDFVGVGTLVHEKAAGTEMNINIPPAVTAFLIANVNASAPSNNAVYITRVGDTYAVDYTILDVAAPANDSDEWESDDDDDGDRECDDDDYYEGDDGEVDCNVDYGGHYEGDEGEGDDSSMKKKPKLF